MPIDANIILQGNNNIPMTLAGLSDPKRLNDIQQAYQQTQGGALDLKQKQQDYADQMTLRDIFQQSSDPAQRNQMMLQRGLVKPYMAQQKFDLEAGKTRAEIGYMGAQTQKEGAQAANYGVETAQKMNDLIGRTAYSLLKNPDGSDRQLTYQEALIANEQLKRQLPPEVAAKMDGSEIPQDPTQLRAWLQQHYDQSMSNKDKIDQHLKAQEISAANQRNAATIAGEDRRAYAGQANARLIAGIDAQGKPLATDQATLTMDAQRYLTDGTLPPNMGRGQQGYMHAQQIRQEAAKIAESNGTDIAGLRAQQISNKAALTKEGQLAGATDTTIRKFNVAISHLDTLGQLADALNNGDTQLINKIGNAYAAQMRLSPLLWLAVVL